MANRTSIEWTQATWNPTVGCSKVSTGCRECYAEQVHEKRLNGVHGYPAFRPWTALNAEHNVTLMPHKLDQPLRWRKPRMVFVNSMSDLFHEQIPDDYIAQVYATMGKASQHTFQVLTKRPERARSLLGDDGFVGAVLDYAFPYRLDDADDADLWPLRNVWLGVSIENRKWVGRADVLRETPSAVRFISAEPLLGPLVDPALPWGNDAGELSLTGIDWLIIGGESGPGHRPFDPQWARDLRDDCLCSYCGGASVAPSSDCPECKGRGWRTAFFLKQLGGSRPGHRA